MAAVSRTRVVVDIETIGVLWEEFSASERGYLEQRSAREDPDVRQYVAKDRLALSPLTGEVVAIGMLNPDTGKGRIHLYCPPTANHRSAELPTLGHAGVICAQIDIREHETEAQLLTAFWSDLERYDQVISFHGRVFDGPFLMLRSMVHGVPVKRNLVASRYDDAHIDLKDRLSFFGINPSYSLDFWCRRLGIPSPKDGMTGKDVETYWRARDFSSVCVYLAGDLRATAELFRKYEATFLARPQA